MKWCGAMKLCAVILIFPMAIGASQRASQNTASLWRIINKLPSTIVDHWTVHQINFFQNFATDMVPRYNDILEMVPRCDDLIRPHDGHILHVISSGFQGSKQGSNAQAYFPPQNAFGDHMGKPWKSQVYNASSIQYPWIGIDMEPMGIQNSTVRCIQIYQGDLPMQGESHLALEAHVGGEWQEKAEWQLSWALRGVAHDGLNSMWMTLPVGIPSVISYTECGIGDAKTSNSDSKCCVWPSIPRLSAMDMVYFQIGIHGENNPKCTPGATVKVGTRCPVSSSGFRFPFLVCPGFTGFFYCINDGVLMDTAFPNVGSHRQNECNEKLLLLLQGGSQVTTNMSKLDVSIKEIEDEADEEDEKEEEEDWKLLHGSTLQVIYVIIGLVAVLSLGLIARKFLQNRHSPRRFHDEPEEPQMHNPVMLGSPSVAPQVAHTEAVVVELQ